MTDFITRGEAQVEYCKLCGICKTPGKKENVEHACIQCFPSKNPIPEIPAADVIPVEWIEAQGDKGKWAELIQRWRERNG